MVKIIKQKQPQQTINTLNKRSYRKRGRMITIGKMPEKLQSFFKPVKQYFSKPAYNHFWALVTAITIGHAATIGRLARTLRGSTHRTKHGEFLRHSDYDESAVTEKIALDILRRLHIVKDPKVFIIVDETQTLKRAKKMDAVGSVHLHSSGTYATGHMILKICLYYRGIIIPWGSWLYVKREHAHHLQIPFRTMTEMAATAVRTANLPKWCNVTVLFDAFYLCPKVVNACKERKWRYIGVARANREFTVNSVKHKLGKYGRNVLRNNGCWHNISGIRTTKTYRLAERVGVLRKLGKVRIVFARRKGEHEYRSLVTNDLKSDMRTIVADYLKRWSIELLIKDQKQHLGLGDYRLLRYRAVVRHLHLVDCAYACLTHLGIRIQSAQGRRKNAKVLRLEPVSVLKDCMRRMIWKENVQYVIKFSHEKKVIRRLEKLLAA